MFIATCLSALVTQLFALSKSSSVQNVAAVIMSGREGQRFPYPYKHGMCRVNPLRLAGWKPGKPQLGPAALHTMSHHFLVIEA